MGGEMRAFCCYGCAIAFQVRHGSREEAQANAFLVRLGVGAFLSMNIMMLSWLLYSGSLDMDGAALSGPIRLVIWLLATPAVTILGWPFALDAWREARRAQIGAAGLVVVGVGGAYAYSTAVLLFGGQDIYLDTAAMVLVLFTLGRYLEAAGRARAARDLTPMMEAESQWVARVTPDGSERCRGSDLRIGDIVRIGPGERVAVDGVVVEGSAYVDEAVISGESRRIDKFPGTRVIAGSVNMDGLLLVRCEATGIDTRWGQICRAVRRAVGARSPLQGIVDRIAAASIPLVLVVASAVLVYGAVRLPLDAAVLRSLAVLVVACPCALGLAGSLATALAVSRLARQGCIVRDGGALETLAHISTIIFDKTGTVTSGLPRMVAVATDGVSIEELLSRAAGLECHAGHALGQAIVAAAEARGLEPTAARDVRVMPGCGVAATAADGVMAAGTASWLVELGLRPWGSTVAANAQIYGARGFTVVHVGWAGHCRGVIAFENELRPEARAVIAALHRLGLRTVLHSGDLPEATRRTAEVLCIADWQARVSPEGKAELVKSWRRRSGPVAMVGDGLNDGLALVGADLGISLGSASALARETADLVLPQDSIALLPWSIELARAVRRTIVSNLAWAFGYNFVAIALAAGGKLPPIIAAALMAGSSLLVIANSLRLERFPAPAKRILANGVTSMAAADMARDAVTGLSPARMTENGDTANLNERRGDMPFAIASSMHRSTVAENETAHMMRQFGQRGPLP
ncbi:MAG: cation-translocating P-type ATPase [Proteobacteria bacterium]|nr:cation-translocating P-type ATPase [Pseudomonadota bacterium]